MTTNHTTSDHIADGEGKGMFLCVSPHLDNLFRYHDTLSSARRIKLNLQYVILLSLIAITDF